jgi:hypothetical protein
MSPFSFLVRYGQKSALTTRRFDGSKNQIKLTPYHSVNWHFPFMVSLPNRARTPHRLV